MSLIYFKNVSLRYTEHALLNEINLRIEAKDRIALIGRNGAGKSTLMKIIEGAVAADSGTIERNVGRMARMEQKVPESLEGTVADYVSQKMVEQCGESWGDSYQVDRVISQLQLNADAPLAQLSGGQLRRCLLAAALVVEPDILLLDEPTNHLDLASIAWLESFLAKTPITFILISHDRTFLQAVCNQIIELDRGRLLQWKGDYNGFIRYREQQLAAQAKYEAEFDKRLAQEEVWIRQGIKARRTRNEGRVRALQKMRNEFAERRRQQGNLRLQHQAAEQSGRVVFEVEDLSYQFEDNTIIKSFSCLIERSAKVGIIGPNGCGKSTLIRCLLKQLEPTAGSVKHGTKISMAYFDQHRAHLDPNQIVMDVIAEGRTQIEIQGKQKHIISYCQDFLFTPQQARSKVKALSGGECNRLLLAKLFSKPANLLILDEPTNDLDIESLELLEEYLLGFSGTVLLISHDRSLLNNVVTSTFVFEGQGHIQEYVGGYDDYLQQSSAQRVTGVAENQLKKQNEGNNKLSYEQQRELKKLPNKIEKIEQQIACQHDIMSQVGFYEKPQSDIDKVQAKLDSLEEKLNEHYARWETLLDQQD